MGASKTDFYGIYILSPSPANNGCCQKETTRLIATYPPPLRLENVPSFWTSRTCRR